MNSMNNSGGLKNIYWFIKIGVITLRQNANANSKFSHLKYCKSAIFLRNFAEATEIQRVVGRKAEKR